MEQKPKYETAGQPPLEKRYREPIIRLNVSLTESQHAWVTDREARGMPASEFIRRLIDRAMRE